MYIIFKYSQPNIISWQSCLQHFFQTGICDLKLFWRCAWKVISVFWYTAKSSSQVDMNVFMIDIKNFNLHQKSLGESFKHMMSLTRELFPAYLNSPGAGFLKVVGL